MVEPDHALNEQANRLAKQLTRRLRAEATRRKIKAQPKLVGSLAKDTHLATHLDIDLFLLFPKTVSRADLERDGLALGKAVLKKPVLRYAEHPYVHGNIDGFKVDVVPAYKLRNALGKISAVDRTPFHTEYVRHHATDRHRREIRLLKAFLHGTGCYGAETATGGFSGYLAELLILRYQTFPKAVQAVSKWTPPVELALEGRPQPLGGPLVFVDPVDASRNAAAAVTGVTLDRLRRAATAFQHHPGPSFFFPNQPAPLKKKDLAKAYRVAPILGLEVPAPPGRAETRIPQGQRLLAKLRRQLEGEGFEVIRDDVHLIGEDRLLLLSEHRPLALLDEYVHRGPPTTDPENSARFLERWSRHKPPPVEREGRWEVRVRRKATAPKEILSPRINQILEGFGYDPLPKPHLLAGPDLVRDASRHLALTLFIEDLDPWDRPPPGKAS